MTSNRENESSANVSSFLDFWNKFIRGRQQRREKSVCSDGIHVEFRWQVKQQSWCGFSMDQLVELIAEAANFFHISDEAKQKIFIYFCDHENFINSSQNESPPIGRETSIDDPDSGEIVRCNILINRSLELVMEHTGLTRKMIAARKRNESSVSTAQGIIMYRPDEPWEVVVRMIAEELNHAAFDLKLKNLEKIKKAQEKYYSYANKFILMSDATERPDSLDLSEVTVSREALRFLEKIAIQRKSPKAKVYRDLYEQSLKHKMAVRFIPRGILDKVFINTRYASRK